MLSFMTIDTIIWWLCILTVVFVLIAIFIALDMAGNQARYNAESNSWDSDQRRGIDAKWGTYGEVNEKVKRAVNKDK